MASQEVVEGLNEILIDGFEIESGLLCPEARLRDDLELDSLDGVDLIVAIEKRFGCRIKEAEARKMRTLNDIYEAIQTLLDGSI
jgi:acyl carrier protein